KAAGTLVGLLLLASPAAQAATHKDVTVTGAGATFPLNMIEQRKSDFNKSTGVNIAYTGVGSGAGRAQLIAGTVDFAGSAVPAARICPSRSSSAPTSRGPRACSPTT